MAAAWFTLPRFRDPITLLVGLNTLTLSTVNQWVTGILLLFSVTNLLDRIVFHCIGNLPSSIWGVEING